MFDAFFQLMSQGGPLMWVIFITAWLAAIMLVERALAIHRWRRGAVVAQSRLQQQADHWPDGGEHSPLAMVMARLEPGARKSAEVLTQQCNVHFAELMPRLEGSLPTIAVIGSLLPMLGLLGTVTGMIEVFEVIALHGTGDPKQMAGGISQALLTTASGLLIAIPVIFSHHLLTRRLRYVLAVTEQSLHLLYERSGSVESDE